MHRTLQTAVSHGSRQKLTVGLMASLLSCLVVIFSCTERAQAVVGGIDATFNPGGAGANGRVSAIAVQPDGKILIGGEFTQYNGINCPKGIVRLNADGTRDQTFNLYGKGVDGTVNAIAVQSDGKILIGGRFSRYNRNNPPIPGGIARLNADGFPDTTFNSGGTGARILPQSGGSSLNGTVSEITLQSNGKIIITGNFNRYNNAGVGRMTRLNEDGTLDTSFDFRLRPTNGTVTALTRISNNRFLIGGTFTSYNNDPIASNHFARLNSDGTLDTTFNYLPPNGAPGVGRADGSGNVSKILMQPDGKIIILGDFTHYNYEPAIPDRCARFNSDLTLDTTFNVNGTCALPRLNLVVVHSQGKMLFAANSGSTNTPAVAFGRLNADGTLDTTFNPGGTGPGNLVHAIAVQPDGKILIGGDFRRYNGDDAAASDRIMRLNIQ